MKAELRNLRNTMRYRLSMVKLQPTTAPAPTRYVESYRLSMVKLQLDTLSLHCDYLLCYRLSMVKLQLHGRPGRKVDSDTLPLEHGEVATS